MSLSNEKIVSIGVVLAFIYPLVIVFFYLGSFEFLVDRDDLYFKCKAEYGDDLVLECFDNSMERFYSDYHIEYWVISVISALSVIVSYFSQRKTTERQVLSSVQISSISVIPLLIGKYMHSGLSYFTWSLAVAIILFGATGAWLSKNQNQPDN